MGNTIHKMVFQPPPPRRADPNKPQRQYIQLKTSRGETIVAYHIDMGYELTVLFSHGNAEDIASCITYCEKVFCKKLKVNAFLYEYSGYGLSSGTPSELNIYSDIEAAFLYITGELKLPPQNIVLFGRSLGSGPTCHLASKYDNVVRFRGVILQSPILSCFRVVLKSPLTLPGDMFANCDKVARIRSPMMVVHGVRDAIVPFHHGKELYERCVAGVDFLWLAEGGHNNLESACGRILFTRYHRFIHELSPKFDPADIKDDERKQAKVSV